MFKQILKSLFFNVKLLRILVSYIKVYIIFYFKNRKYIQIDVKFKSGITKDCSRCWFRYL